MPEALITPEPAPAPEPEADAEQKPLIFAGTVRSLDQAPRTGWPQAHRSSRSTETRITTRETIIAIEKAKTDLESALGVTRLRPRRPKPPHRGRAGTAEGNRLWSPRSKPNSMSLPPTATKSSSM